MFDTHCHLNFQAFNSSVDDVIQQAISDGITQITIPGTDIVSSKKAIEIASKYENIHAAVGIHPHHVKEFQIADYKLLMTESLKEIENILQHPKVVAVGEVGIDRHIYEKTKYEDTSVDEEYIEMQKIFLIEQIKLAIKYKKSLILHNREAKKDMLEVLEKSSNYLSHSVFHCCEADIDLLDFAKAHKMFIGIDGDISWSKKKQRFIKEVPLEMLVLETDSPFLTPDPIRKEYTQNTPSNLRIICEKVAEVKEESFETIAQVTQENANMLFSIE